MTQIPVDKEAWDSISDEDKKKIENAFKKLHTIAPGDSFVGGAKQIKPEWDPIGDLCRAGCDAAAAAAIAWCVANTGGAATAVCIAAAHAARDECRRHC